MERSAKALGVPYPSAAMHISSQLPHWGAALPGEMARYIYAGIPAKSVNYFYGNMKDA